MLGRDELWRWIGRFLVELTVLNVVTIWFLFWGLVIRLHYVRGNMIAIAITAGLFVAPVAVATVWHLGDVLGVQWAVESRIDGVVSAT